MDGDVNVIPGAYDCTMAGKFEFSDGGLAPVVLGGK